MPNLGERLLLVFTSIAAALSAFLILASFVMVGNRTMTTSEAFGVQLFCCLLSIGVWGTFRIGLFLFAPGTGHEPTRKIALLIGFSPVIIELGLIFLGMLVHVFG